MACVGSHLAASCQHLSGEFGGDVVAPAGAGAWLTAPGPSCFTPGLSLQCTQSPLEAVAGHHQLHLTLGQAHPGTGK